MSLTRGESVSPASASGPLTALADKVALYSYRVTDEELAALRASGVPEDAIYETIVSAAVGAGMARLDYALAALRRER